MRPLEPPSRRQMRACIHIEQTTAQRCRWAAPCARRWDCHALPLQDAPRAPGEELCPDCDFYRLLNNNGSWTVIPFAIPRTRESEVVTSLFPSGGQGAAAQFGCAWRGGD